jgi:trans-aconitate 2-methyltransferase
MTTTAPGDSWDPDQYRKFAAERAQPFHDLVALVSPIPGGRAVDLGCGTGELTAELHDGVGAALTVGIDSSEAMLAQARPLARPGLRFEPGDIATFHRPASGPGSPDPAGRYDLVFSNAALQWVPDHVELFGRLATALRPGGQLAVQMPANADHPGHLAAAEVALEPPFLEAMDGRPPPDPVGQVMAPERYAELLDRLGFATQRARLEVYGHRLASSGAVVEWTRGTSLTRFTRVLTPELFEAFLVRYRQRLLEVLGDQAPYFYAFKRILLWGRLPEP